MLLKAGLVEPEEDCFEILREIAEYDRSKRGKWVRHAEWVLAEERRKRGMAGE